MPTWVLLQKIIGYFNIIWDDAEEVLKLAGHSHPRVVIDTSGLSPEATELANLLATEISRLETDEIRERSANEAMRWTERGGRSAAIDELVTRSSRERPPRALR